MAWAGWELFCLGWSLGEEHHLPTTQLYMLNHCLNGEKSSIKFLHLLSTPHCSSHPSSTVIRIVFFFSGPTFPVPSSHIIDRLCLNLLTFSFLFPPPKPSTFLCSHTVDTPVSRYGYPYTSCYLVPTHTPPRVIFPTNRPVSHPLIIYLFFAQSRQDVFRYPQRYPPHPHRGSC